ncbi:DUF5667 domain-containing protein [Streptomyces sp. B1866]|uniref:DUF5667 domain-containing protein n=1 Tax=Streptomyces sp. B1866 TaxID=3075431 RepID=UPI00288D7301|nr:DUF5667 domain-containing protein [Streptomyces sp. B1866]MDT3398860.1 DUF5667 domain-containing protein [Streptomyces sp. B1866]
MIANVSAHRRAHAFAQALEALEALGSRSRSTLGGQDQDLDRALRHLPDPADPLDELDFASHPDLTDGSAEGRPAPSAEQAERDRMLALTGGLRRLPAPQLDPDVRAAQRARLMAATQAANAERASRVPEPRPEAGPRRRLGRLKPRSRWSKGLAAGSLTVGVAAGAFGGVAAASSDALPGDTLYGLKRGMEDLKLEMAHGDAARGRLYLHQAATRMGEARRLMERGRSGDLDHESLREIRKALSGMRHDAAEGHRLLHGVYERDGSLGALKTLSSFSTDHRAGWTRLRDMLPAQLFDVGDQVSSVLDAIDHEVGPLRALLPGEHGGGIRPERMREEHTARAEPGRTARPSPSASPQRDSRPADSGSGQPRPSASSAEKPQGLLGGVLGQPEDPSASPSVGKSDQDGRTTQPDITIPPLLPGLLPGLGLSGGGEESPK